MPAPENVVKAKADLNARIYSFDPNDDSQGDGDGQHPLTVAIEALMDAKVFQASTAAAVYNIDPSNPSARFGDDD